MVAGRRSSDGDFQDAFPHHYSEKHYYSCYAYANLAAGKTAGQEQEVAGQTIASDSYTFMVRYCAALSDMDSDHYRILFEGGIYNITLVDDFQFRHKTLKLTATKVRR